MNEEREIARFFLPFSIFPSFLPSFLPLSSFPSYFVVFLRQFAAIVSDLR